MKLNQFTLPARMANKAACWGRSYRTLKPKGRLSHAWSRRFKGNTHTKEREFLRGGEQPQTLSLAPNITSYFCSFPTIIAQLTVRSCKTCLAMKDQVGQVGSAPYFPVSQHKDHWYFCSKHCIIWVLLLCPKILLNLENVHNFYFRLTLLFCHVY